MLISKGFYEAFFYNLGIWTGVLFMLYDNVLFLLLGLLISTIFFVKVKTK